MQSQWTDSQIIARLDFEPGWFECGVINGESLSKIVESFRQSDDDNAEHYRFGAFVAYLNRTPLLSPDQFDRLFTLGTSDPEPCMGRSMLVELLARPDCPDALYDRAAAIDGLTAIALEMKHRQRFDTDQPGYRERLRSAGADTYLASYGCRQDGRPRSRERLACEMNILFGLSPAQIQDLKRTLRSREHRHDDSP